MLLPNDHTAGTARTTNARCDGGRQRSRLRSNHRGSLEEQVLAELAFSPSKTIRKRMDHVSAIERLPKSRAPMQAGETVSTITTSIVRTIELYLGLPPMNIMDATAPNERLLYDSRTSRPSYRFHNNRSTNWRQIQKRSPTQLRKDAIASAKLPLNEPTVSEDVLNRILCAQ
jgi:hypothetical protein